MQLNEPNPEWYTYGSVPAVWSAGGDLIGRGNYRKVNGYLNGPGAVRALTMLQRWFDAGYVDPNKRGRRFRGGSEPDLVDRRRTSSRRCRLARQRR